MILFYNKKTGNIFATIDGRIHTSQIINTMISNSSIKKEGVGKFIIGFEQIDKEFKGHHTDLLPILKKFESNDDDPLKYKVKNGLLIRQ